MRLFMIQPRIAVMVLLSSSFANDGVGPRVVGVTLTPYDFWRRRSRCFTHDTSGKSGTAVSVIGGNVDTAAVARVPRAMPWGRAGGYRGLPANQHHPVRAWPRPIYFIEQHLAAGGLMAEGLAGLVRQPERDQMSAHSRIL